MRLLYLGDKLSKHTRTKGVIENLAPLLAEFCEIKTASDKKAPMVRALDFIGHFFWYGLRSDRIMIDTYSTRAFYYAFFMGLLCWFFGKPYFLFLHGGNLPARYARNPRLVHFLFARARALVAPSAYLCQFFQAQGYGITLIPNHLALNEYPFKQRAEIYPKLLNIRGLGKPYNPLMTLKAVALLKPKVPGLQLGLVGEPSEHYYPEVMAFIAQHHLADTVRLLRRMPQKDWIELAHTFDIMVSTPDIDNTPVSLLEGLALGMCVVSTRVGGVPYLVTDRETVLVESNDHEQLARQIEQLLQDPARCRALSCNGRQKAEQFTWANIKPGWVKLLTS
ncbi:MAG: glycosyltransferase family 4 protein [Bernardetiaceae bacterium]|jgi:glycosyltransferase involved in cell wall biosynthesis|nr:glycosyltransferase family 4 protein [Bernardetiaceae bacterium]